MKTTRPALSPPLMAGLTADDTAAVLARGTTRVFAPGTVMCRQGEPAGAAFLVQTGRVRFARTTAHGRDVLIRKLGPGECFGLASFVPGPVNYMGTALVAEEACIVSWRGADMREAAGRWPVLSENVLRIAFHYLEEFGERHVALLSQSAEQRVARTITHLGATSGRVLPTGVEVEISNNDLAALADVGMFTVSRQLKRWEREGHLLKSRQKVLIRHPEALVSV